MDKNTIKCGDRVRDVVTGFSGVVIARTEYINGCVQLGISPKADKDKMHDSQWVDWQRLEIIGKPVQMPQRNDGGPQPTPSCK